MQQRAAPFLFLLLAASCTGSTPDVVIERVAIDVRVLPDGDATVAEEWTIRPGKGPLTEFTRAIPRGRHDGISEVVPDPTGARIRGGASPAVRWAIGPPAGSVTLRLRYRAHKVVGVAGLNGSITWAALDSRLAAPIGNAALTLVLPENTPLTADPWVEEAGWDVTRTAHGLTATRTALPPATTATMGAKFALAGLSLDKPQWQYEEARAAEFAPAFISAGLFILVVGAGVLAMMRFRFTRGAHADLSDAERRAECLAAARDLHWSGIVALVIGIAATATTARMPGGFGIWSYSIGASVVIVGIAFVIFAPRFKPR